MTNHPHRDPVVRPLVVKVGGALLDDERARGSFLDRVRAAQTQGHDLVLVHGGGAAVDRHLRRVGVETERIDGIRITPPATMPEIAGVLAGDVGTMLVADLRRRGVTAVGLRLGDDPGIRTERLKADFDPGAVGTVTGGRADLIKLVLGTGATPVVASIGFLADGSPVNVNADDAAAGVAGALDAAALLLLTDVPGVLDAGERTIPELDAGRIELLLAAGTIRGGMIPKVRSALATAEATGTPVVIAHWADPVVLLDPLLATTTTTIQPSPIGVRG